MKNHYDVLGVPSTASVQEIKTAYRKLSMKFHPDKNNGEAYFESMFKSINEAHEVLTNDIKRASYDSLLNKSANESRAVQDDIRKREEDLRRRQEELLEREKQLKTRRPQSPSYSIPSSSSPGVDWSKVINIFLLTNLFLLGLIVATPSKNDKQVKRATISQPITNKVSPSGAAPGKHYTSAKATVVATIDDEGNRIDSLKAENPTTLAETPPVQANIHLPTTKPDIPPVTVTDSIGKMPRWFQFKKRKAWRKKLKETDR